MSGKLHLITSNLKIYNYILETRISFLPSDNRKNLTWSLECVR